MAAEQEKVQRRVYKTAVTRQVNKIRQLIAEEDSNQVKAEIEQLIVKFGNFESAHDRYHATLQAENELDESEEYFTNTQEVYIKFLNETKVWLKQGNAAPNTEQASKVEKGSEFSPEQMMNVLCLPKIELSKFNGDPLHYHSFIALFDETVDKVAESDKIKLTRLIQYTSGKAYEAIRTCSLMEGSTGYQHARKMLLERFGNTHLVTERLINNLREGNPVKTADELQVFCDDLNNCNMILKQMDKLKEVENQSYIVQITDRLQPYIRNRWRRRAMDIKKAHDRYPQFEELVQFVKDQTAEAIDPVYGKPLSTARDGAKNRRLNALTSGATGNAERYYGFKQSCVLCKGDHRLFYCQQFKDLKPMERLQLVIRHKLCENCLLSNHSTANCRKMSVCSVPGCGERHTKFIHVSNREPGGATSTGSNSNVRLLNANVNVNSDVHMPVVAVRVNGDYDTCMLLDTASSNSFCTAKLMQSLKLQGTPVTYALSTLNASEDIQSRVVNLSLKSLDGQECLEIPNVYVVNSIPVKSTCPEPGVHPHLKGLTLVEGGQDINLLVGQDNAEALMPLEVRRGGKGEPFACRTLFGWSVNGPCQVNGPISRKVVSQFISTSSLEEKVHNLWQMENEGLGSHVSLSHEDKGVIELWDKECKLVEGHYEIPIPWKPKVDVPNNLVLAMSRLKSLKLSLNKRGLVARYDEEIQKLLENRYAERVPVKEMYASRNVWYLPHHGVISDKKPDKLRVVFDCAAMFHGESLNDKCYRGPDLNNKLLNVLVRFRQHGFAIQADIEAMYYQVKVPVKDRDVLRFLWYDADGNVNHYRMTGHVFGGVWCASSSTYALRRTVADNPDIDPLIYDCVTNSFYVDDCLRSVCSRGEARTTIDGTKSVLKEGGFRLTKFVINDSELQSTIAVSDRAKEAKDLGSCVEGKALGVKWDVANDQFYFEVNAQVKGQVGRVTRRIMLSTIATCFDPLGLVSPFIVGGKLLFQEATRLKLSWDEDIPRDLEKEWNRWISVLQDLSTLRIPRCIKPNLFDDAMIELHHFSDASLKAYGACSYVRCINKHGAIFTVLVASKGKVAPIKAVTIPRLELQAAVLSARMDKFLRQELDVCLGNSYFWVDSQLVLRYICNETRRFQVFVGNRVSVIREFSDPAQWSHVPGKENPADLITRNQDHNSLDRDRWLHGPKFLRTHKSEWQSIKVELDLSGDDPEVKKEVKSHASAIVSSPVLHIDKLLQHYSSWIKLKKAVAWLLRYKDFLRGHRKFEGYLTAKELKEAEVNILRHVQSSNYGKECKSLLKDESVGKDSSIRSLTPVMGEDGLIRVGGRLKNAVGHGVCSQPVIIPHCHPVAR